VAGLRACIRRCLDCADTCETTARLLTRADESRGDVLRAQVEACRAACRACAEECERHAHHHEHCRVCAECCRACEAACDAALSAMA